MPNNIQNKLILSGPKRSIEKIVGKEEFSLGIAVPPPRAQVPQMRLSLQNWFVEHWGTKWDAWDAVKEKDGDNTVIYFKTAWSAPFAWLEKVKESFPDVQIFSAWVDLDDFPTAGTFGSDETVEEGGKGRKRKANSMDIVKNHFPRLCAKYAKVEKKEAVVEEISNLFGKQWDKELNANVKVYLSSANSVGVAVWRPRGPLTEKGKWNEFDDLPFKTREELQTEAEKLFEEKVGEKVEKRRIAKNPTNPFKRRKQETKSAELFGKDSISSRTRLKTKK